MRVTRRSGLPDGVGVAVAVGPGVASGGSVICGEGVASAAAVGLGEAVALGSARTGSPYVSRPAARSVTPTAVSRAGSRRVRIRSVGPVMGAES